MTENSESYVIGITGGVGSGKSTVLALLEDTYHAKIILSDEVAHRLMQPGGSSYLALLRLLGNEICSPDGTIDRKKMAARIFSDPILTQRVNEITHPLVIEAITEEINLYRSKNTALIIVETALPVEGSLNAWCDEIWYIYVPADIRINRLMADRGYSKEKCLEIINQQLSDASYLAIADRVIDNSQDWSDTAKQISECIQAIESRT